MCFIENHVCFASEVFCYFSMGSALKTLLKLIYMLTTLSHFSSKTLSCDSTFGFLDKIFSWQTHDLSHDPCTYYLDSKNQIFIFLISEV